MDAKDFLGCGHLCDICSKLSSDKVVSSLKENYLIWLRRKGYSKRCEDLFYDQRQHHWRLFQEKDLSNGILRRTVLSRHHLLTSRDRYNIIGPSSPFYIALSGPRLPLNASHTLVQFILEPLFIAFFTSLYSYLCVLVLNLLQSFGEQLWIKGL